jgi:ABC-type transporter MlaC component
MLWLWAGLLCLVVLLRPASAAIASETPADAAAYVAAFIEQAANLTQAEAGAKDQAQEPWRRLVGEHLDMPSIARFVVGPAWSAADAGQRDELVTLIEARISAFYARQVRADRGALFDLLGSEPIGPDGELVKSRLTRPDGSVQAIEWRVQQTPSGFRIRDIIADGQSLAAAKRAEYTSILQRNHGNVDALIEALRLGAAAEDAL